MLACYFQKEEDENKEKIKERKKPEERKRHVHKEKYVKVILEQKTPYCNINLHLRYKKEKTK